MSYIYPVTKQIKVMTRKDSPRFSSKELVTKATRESNERQIQLNREYLENRRKEIASGAYDDLIELVKDSHYFDFLEKNGIS